MASFLVKRGMKSGDKIIYLTFDITKMFAIVIGVWRTGLQISFHEQVKLNHNPYLYAT